ncbi:MAG: hypothetical protein IJ088_13710 [Clostridia bacterium]|nr:hypothetical protein [Clostridia bacterium]
MRGIPRMLACLLTCALLAGGTGPAFAELRKLKAGTIRDFARSAPVSGVRVDTDRLCPELVRMEQKPAGDCSFVLEENGCILAEHVPVREGASELGSVMLTFSDAAILSDGRRVDFHLNFTQITVFGRKGNGEYLDRLMICRLNSAPGNEIMLSPLSMDQRKHIGILYDLECVIDTETEEGFLFTANGINNSRKDGNRAAVSEVVDAEKYNLYSETAVIDEDSLLSSLHFPNTSPFVVRGNQFIGNAPSGDRYDYGIAFVGKTTGTRIRFISSAGTNTQPLETYIMPGGLTHVVSLSAGPGGQVCLRADGSTYESGEPGTVAEYDVPNGKRVSCVLEPDDAHGIDRVMFNGEEIDISGENGYHVDGRKAVFFLEVDSYDDLAISVTWKAE